jgi:hypothetical protein
MFTIQEQSYAQSQIVARETFVEVARDKPGKSVQVLGISLAAKATLE